MSLAQFGLLQHHFDVYKFTVAPSSLVPRPHPRGEEKGSGYSTTFRLILEGRNQIPL